MAKMLAELVIFALSISASLGRVQIVTYDVPQTSHGNSPKKSASFRQDNLGGISNRKQDGGFSNARRSDSGIDTGFNSHRDIRPDQLPSFDDNTGNAFHDTGLSKVHPGVTNLNNINAGNDFQGTHSLANQGIRDNRYPIRTQGTSDQTLYRPHRNQDGYQDRTPIVHPIDNRGRGLNQVHNNVGIDGNRISNNKDNNNDFNTNLPVDSHGSIRHDNLNNNAFSNGHGRQNQAFHDPNQGRDNQNVHNNRLAEPHNSFGNNFGNTHPVSNNRLVGNQGIRSNVQLDPHYNGVIGNKNLHDVNNGDYDNGNSRNQLIVNQRLRSPSVGLSNDIHRTNQNIHNSANRFDNGISNGNQVHRPNLGLNKNNFHRNGIDNNQNLRNTNADYVNNRNVVNGIDNRGVHGSNSALNPTFNKNLRNAHGSNFNHGVSQGGLVRETQGALSDIKNNVVHPIVNQNIGPNINNGLRAGNKGFSNNGFGGQNGFQPISSHGTIGGVNHVSRPFNPLTGGSGIHNNINIQPIGGKNTGSLLHGGSSSLLNNGPLRRRAPLGNLDVISVGSAIRNIGPVKHSGDSQDSYNNDDRVNTVHSGNTNSQGSSRGFNSGNSFVGGTSGHRGGLRGVDHPVNLPNNQDYRPANLPSDQAGNLRGKDSGLRRIDHPVNLPTNQDYRADNLPHSQDGNFRGDNSGLRRVVHPVNLPNNQDYRAANLPHGQDSSFRGDNTGLRKVDHPVNLPANQDYRADNLPHNQDGNFRGDNSGLRTNDHPVNLPNNQDYRTDNLPHNQDGNFRGDNSGLRTIDHPVNQPNNQDYRTDNLPHNQDGSFRGDNSGLRRIDHPVNLPNNQEYRGANLPHNQDGNFRHGESGLRRVEHPANLPNNDFRGNDFSHNQGGNFRDDRSGLKDVVHPVQLPTNSGRRAPLHAVNLPSNPHNDFGNAGGNDLLDSHPSNRGFDGGSNLNNRDFHNANSGDNRISPRRTPFNNNIHSGAGQPHSGGAVGPRNNRDCFRDLDLGSDFEFSDKAVNFPRQKIIRELQGRPHLRTKMGLGGAFPSDDFSILNGFSKVRKSSSNGDAFGTGFGSVDGNIFNIDSEKTVDFSSRQLQRLKGVVSPASEICPNIRRPLRSFSMGATRCFTLTRRDSPLEFATCQRRDCPECSRNRGVGKCMEEYERTSVFAWCDDDAPANSNIRQVSLLVPKHCGGRSYDC